MTRQVVRIMSVRATAVARILAIIYGVLGCGYVPALLFRDSKEIVLPIGVIAPLIDFSFKLHLQPPTHFLTGVLSEVAATVSYGVSGWLTGGVAALAFNFVAGRIGGIDTSLFAFVNSPPPKTSASVSSENP